MQYWKDVEDDKTKLIVVTDEAVYAQKLGAAACQRQLDELLAGKSPATAFSADATHVVLRTVNRVQQAHDEDDIDFISRVGKDDNTESLTINDAGIRSEVFAAVERVTRGRFQRYQDQYSRPRAAFGALMTLTIFGFITKLLVSAATVVRNADEYEVDGRNQGLKKLFVWVLDLLGPTGVTVIGVILCALTVFVLVTRIKSPPSLQILHATPYKAQGPIVTGIKYAVLIAAWVIVLPIMLR